MLSPAPRAVSPAGHLAAGRTEALALMPGRGVASDRRHGRRRRMPRLVVNLRSGQNESGPHPLVIPAWAKASIADSAQWRLSSEKASGTSRESPSALTAIAANSARVRSLSGQNALGAQPRTMPSAASRLIAFWNVLFPSSLKKSFEVGGRPITRWKKAAASPLVMVRSGQARRYPHPKRSPRACNSVRAGLKRLELSSLNGSMQPTRPCVDTAT